MKKSLRSLIALALAATALAGGSGARATTLCPGGTGSGGDWTSHGGDVSSTRSQAAENTIDATSVTNLAPKWQFSVAGINPADTGAVQTTPIEANGCVYITTTGGWLYALDAGTGALDWDRQVAGTPGGTLSVAPEAPAVSGTTLYLNIPSDPATSADKAGAYVAAFNALDGTPLWTSDKSFVKESSASANGFFASTVYYDGLVVEGLTNDEMTSGARVGGFVIVDAATHEVLKRTYIIPDDEAKAGFGGCSEWSTSLVDPQSGYAYVGTGQPSSWTDKQSEMCDAIIKYDLARERDANGNPVAVDSSVCSRDEAGTLHCPNPNFGEIVGATKGIPDGPPYLDVDFGASPTLLHGADGRQIVADLQKAGQVTAAYTRHMTLAWRTPVSPVGAALGNYTSSATDGTNIFTVGAYPGQMISLSGTTGLPNWVFPVRSPVATPNIAYANGVVYYADETGVLYGVDASLGIPKFVRPIAADVGAPCANLGGGVAIARHEVIASCGAYVSTYALP